MPLNETKPWDFIPSVSSMFDFLTQDMKPWDWANLSHNPTLTWDEIITVGDSNYSIGYVKRNRPKLRLTVRISDPWYRLTWELTDDQPLNHHAKELVKLMDQPGNGLWKYIQALPLELKYLIAEFTYGVKI